MTTLELRGDIGKLLWSNQSPDAGDPTCLCSACGKWISEDCLPIRLFDQPKNLEARFCDACAFTWLGIQVAEELAALELERFDFTMTGFSDADLERMLEDLAGAPPATKPEKGPNMTTEFNKKPAAAIPPDLSSNAPAPGAPVEPASSVPSESDARTVNSTDESGNVMRHAYRVLTVGEKKTMVELKDAGLALWNKIHALDAAGSREIAIAKTKCQEAVMWAVSHLTK